MAEFTVQFSSSAVSWTFFNFSKLNDSDRSYYNMSCEKKLIWKWKSPRESFCFQLICLTKGPIIHWVIIAMNHLLKFYIQPVYFFVCFCLGRLAFCSCFGDTKHMSQSVFATVPLQARLNLCFDIFHFCIFLLKSQQYIFKNTHRKLFHYRVLSKIFKSF